MIRARSTAAILACILVGAGFVIGAFAVHWLIGVTVLVVTVLWALRVGAK